MINVIKAEYLKYKRSFTRRLILLAPLFFIIVALPQKLFMPSDYLRPFQLIISLVYNWWPVIFIPFGMALFATLIEAQEKRGGNYRSLRVHDISPITIWLGKIIVMAVHTFLTTIVLILAIVISGLITAKGSIPWSKIFVGGFLLWFTSLAIIPLQLWAAAWKGTFASMAMGAIGFIIGVIAAPKHYWIYVPWSWPTRLMSPVIGVHPNGTLLEPMDPLLNSSVIPVGIIVSLIALITFTLITSLWFAKKEVQ